MFVRRGRGEPRDPAFGVVYNQIVDCYNLSRRVFSFDIARTPMIIKNIGTYADVQGDIYNANGERGKLNKSFNHFNKGSTG